MNNLYAVLTVTASLGVIALIVFAIKALIQITRTASEAEITIVQLREHLSELDQSIESLNNAADSITLLTNNVNNKIDSTKEIFSAVDSAGRILRTGLMGVTGALATRLTGALAAHFLNKRTK